MSISSRSSKILPTEPLTGSVVSIGSNALVASEIHTLSEEELLKKAEDEDWERQVRENEEAEKWEAAIVNIPEALFSSYEPLLQALPAIRRAQILKMLDAMEWKLEKCQQMLTTLTQVPKLMIETVIDILVAYPFTLALSHAINFFPRLTPDVVMEVLNDIPPDTFLHVTTEVTRHLEDSDLDTLAALSARLSFRYMMGLLEDVKEPWADKCRLCRVRRLYKLSDRMCSGQVPPGLPEITGVLPLYDKAEIWAADDEKGFRFDEGRGRVYWQRELVDLERICRDCLMDVNQAASCCTRFDEFYHISAKTRKVDLRQLREKEQSAARMIAKMVTLDIRRRARDCALKAIRTARHGNRLENDERRRLQQLEQQRLEKIRLEQLRQDMISSALSVDSKWRAEDRKADQINLQRQQDIVGLTYKAPYGRDNPAPATREHPHSWTLSHSDARGLPASAEAAAERFGLGKVVPNTRLSTLKAWKQETIAAHAAYLEDQRRIKEAVAEAAHKELHQLQHYVDFRSKQIDRETKRISLTLEIVEENRVAKRKADRDARRAARIAGYEAAERELMSREDIHSRQRMFFEQETARQEAELVIMREQEILQKQSKDWYWGLDEARRLQLEAEALIRQLWEQRVEDMRERCIRVRIVKPFEDEVRRKVFRDRITNKVIA